MDKLVDAIRHIDTKGRIIAGFCGLAVIAAIIAAIVVPIMNNDGLEYSSDNERKVGDYVSGQLSAVKDGSSEYLDDIFKAAYLDDDSLSGCGVSNADEVRKSVLDSFDYQLIKAYTNDDGTYSITANVQSKKIYDTMTAWLESYAPSEQDEDESDSDYYSREFEEYGAAYADTVINADAEAFGVTFVCTINDDGNVVCDDFTTVVARAILGLDADEYEDNIVNYTEASDVDALYNVDDLEAANEEYREKYESDSE